MKITLSKALKLKKKKAGRISWLMQTIRVNNSLPEDAIADYNVTELMAELDKEVDSLINLKVAINEANKASMAMISRIPELKTRIAFLQGMPTEEGKETHGYREAIVVIKKAVINTVRRDEMIKEAQEWLEQIQDQLDQFNALTQIEI